MNLTSNEIYKYIISGHSIFTIESTRIWKRYTYKVIKTKNLNVDRYGDWYNVYRLFGPENDNKKSYRFMGTFYNTYYMYYIPKLFKCPVIDVSVAMFNRVLSDSYSNIKLPETCNFYKSNHCCKCGKRLTTPESIKAGIGPYCNQLRR